MEEDLGIDVGSTFIKTAILSSDPGRLRKSIRRVPAPLFLAGSERSNCAELDPFELVHTVEDAINRVIDEFGAPKRIFLTGQQHGVILLDSDRCPVSPICTWQDRRSLIVSDVGRSPHALLKEFVDSNRSALGGEYGPGHPLLTLSLLQKESTGVPVFVESLLSWVGRALCGFPEKCSKMHVTDAASFGLYSIETGSWFNPALLKAEAGNLTFPEIVSEVCAIGEHAGTEATVFCPVGDHQASMVGIGLRANEVSINVGTSCQITSLSPAQCDVPGLVLRPRLSGGLLGTVTHLASGKDLSRIISEVARAHGNVDDSWEWVSSRIGSDPSSVPEIEDALESLVSSYVRTAYSIHGGALCGIALSGGLSSRFPPFVESLKRYLSPETHLRLVFGDAALSGLSVLSKTIT